MSGFLIECREVFPAFSVEPIAESGEETETIALTVLTASIHSPSERDSLLSSPRILYYQIWLEIYEYGNSVVSVTTT